MLLIPAVLVFLFYRFIKRFASIAEPLYATLKKDYSWKNRPQGKNNPEWEAFNRIKLALAMAPVLAKPDWTKLFRLYTDASAIGVGAVLSQDNAKRQKQVICYASRGTRGAEKNYESTKLECLAVVWAVKWFRYYLIGRHFEVITDHSVLKWLFNRP